MAQLILRNPNEPEFHQPSARSAESLASPHRGEPRIAENESSGTHRGTRARHHFPCAWLNDKGEIEINRGYRVQMNSAIGPYKGGIRFHPSVNLSILKFLAFEQTFKNSLTTLPMGGGKGGSDFNPKAAQTTR